MHPSVTVIVVSQDQEDDLRRNLPKFLSQEYEGEFHVTVSDIRSKDGTLDMLEDLEELHQNLSHSSVPVSARDISLQRLAMMLGVRSSFTEWVVFTQADCCPKSNGWLKNVMAECGEDKDAVLGITAYSSMQGWTERKRQFFRLWQQTLWLSLIGRAVPYRADDSFLCYRRSHFMEHGGFGIDSNLMGGASSLLVNKNINKERYGVAISPESMLLQSQPRLQSWNQERVFFMETRSHLVHTCLYRSWYFACVALPLLFVLLTLIAILLNTNNFAIMAFAILLCLVLALLRQLSYASVARVYGISPSSFSYPILSSLIALWDLTAWVEWRFTKKKTFRKKFV